MESPDSYLAVKTNFIISKIYDGGMNLIGRYNFCCFFMLTTFDHLKHPARSSDFDFKDIYGKP